MSSFHLYTIGKPKLKYAQAGVEEYLTRLKRYGPAEWKPLKEMKGDDAAIVQARESESLLNASEGMFRVILDERGKALSSRQLAQKIDDWEMRAVRQVAFLIGGADGHTQELRAKSDTLWTLSSYTLQHELALVVLLEQLYRAQTIRRGEPYHRD